MSFVLNDGMKAGVCEDRLFNGRLILRQPIRGHRVGTDAVLLAAAAPRAAGLIVDAGAGVGAVGIAAALRSPQASLELIDADPDSCTLAQENLALNGLDRRGRVIEADLLSAASRRAAGLADGRAELVLTNPPFHDAGAVRLSPDERKARAHALSGAGAQTIEGWIRMITALAAPDARIVMIHRADRLDAVLAACAGRLSALAVMPIYSRQGEPAARVLIGARKGGRAPLRLLNGLTLHADGNRFTETAEAIHRGRLDISIF